MNQDVKKTYLETLGANMDVDVCVDVNVYHQVMQNLYNTYVKERWKTTNHNITTPFSSEGLW